MKTLLIFGGGFRVGLGVARAFKDEGYTVGLVSRNIAVNEAAKEEGFKFFEADFADLTSIERVYKEAQSSIGTPNIVIFNASAASYDESRPMGASSEQLLQDLRINIVAPFEVLQQTLGGFQVMAQNIPKVFIATGNVLPWQPKKQGATLGPGKAGLAHLVQLALVSQDQHKCRVYYASQVSDQGGPVEWDDVSSAAHGRAYTALVARMEQGLWDVRFNEKGDIVS